MFTKENLDKLDQLKKRYPTTKALTLHTLWMAQEQFGWISPETMKYVADVLNLPVTHIYGVVSFYTMFNTKPVGKYHLQICTNISCQLLGAEKLTNHICGRLNINMGETTPDKKFTLSEVECLGSCGTPPPLQGEDTYTQQQKQ